MTFRGRYEQIDKFNTWISKQDYAKKIVIAGNHDLTFESNPSEAQSMLRDCDYVQDQQLVYEGIKFYGSPWQPEFCDWAFNLRRGDPLKEKWDLIPEDTAILVTHGPSLDHGDKIAGIFGNAGQNVGCYDLRDAIRRIKPAVHVFGHIHEGYGITYEGDTMCINASSCNEHYALVNKPIWVDIEIIDGKAQVTDHGF